MLEVQFFFQKIHFYQAESHLSSTDTQQGILKYIAIREVGIRLNKDTRCESVLRHFCDMWQGKLKDVWRILIIPRTEIFDYLRQFCDAWHVTRDKENGKGGYRDVYVYIWMYSIFNIL